MRFSAKMYLLVSSSSAAALNAARSSGLCAEKRCSEIVLLPATKNFSVYYFSKKNRILQVFAHINILCRKKVAFFTEIIYNKKQREKFPLTNIKEEIV